MRRREFFFVLGRMGAWPLATRTTAAVPLLATAPTAVSAAEPVKVGFSIALTGAVAQNGKQFLVALPNVRLAPPC